MALLATHNETQFGVGDLVRVFIADQKARRKTLSFEGRVLSIRGEGDNKSFMVRRIGAAGIGIERIFPLYSPLVAKIEVKQKLGEGVRHAKLYSLRENGKSGVDDIVRRIAKKNQMVKSSKRKQARSKRKK